MANDPDRVDTIVQEWRRERPDLDVSPIAVIGRLHRLAAALTRELALVYARFDLGEGEFDVLAALRRAGDPFERNPKDLAEHTMVTTGAMTKRLDRLEAAGLVSRRRSATDGRSRVVGLTPAGRDLIDRAIEAHVANEHRLVGLLDAGDADALRDILDRWLRRL